jgi:hypothetical protein
MINNLRSWAVDSIFSTLVSTSSVTRSDSDVLSP